MEAEEFYKQRSNSIRELWALSPKQIEYIAFIMEEYAALRQPLVSGQSEQFYCADWNRCGSICEEQCNTCNKAENMPEVVQ